MNRIILFLILYLSLCVSSFADNRIYSVIVPFSAGGPSDVLARHIVSKLNNRLANQEIKLIVENTPGAAGSVGLKKIINSKDRPVFGFFSPFFAINASMRHDYVYDYNSVNYLGFAGYNKMMVISGIHSTMQDLHNRCATDKEIIIGSSGIGSTSHLAVYYFVRKYLGCENIVDIPYKGVSSAYVDLKSGRIDLLADFSITAMPFIETNYFNKIAEIKDTDLLSWHIFVSNVDNDVVNIVRKEFELLKKDADFSKSLETQFHVYKFTETKDSIWLKGEFESYKTIIESLPTSRK